jgi:hypothetical protein
VGLDGTDGWWRIVSLGSQVLKKCC